jgi:hypothetical protein
MSDSTNPTEILSAIEDAAGEGNPVRIDTILDHLDQRGIGALLLVPPALEISPVGGIPGVPTILATLTALFAIQIVIGREDLWVPGFLGRRKVQAERLCKAVDWLRPTARWADRRLGRHIPILVDPPAQRIAALAIVAMCFTVPPLELIPFASTIPMGAAVLFGLGLLTQDGRVMALAWAATIGGLVAVWFLWPG